MSITPNPALSAGMTGAAELTPAGLRAIVGGAAVYPAAPCRWCGRSFTARDAWEEVPACGPRGTVAYVHAACGAEFAEAIGLRAGLAAAGVAPLDPSDAAVWGGDVDGIEWDGLSWSEAA